MRIAIDVDMTIVDSGNMWLEWLEEKAGRRVERGPWMPYNLATLFPEMDNEEGMGFWKSASLYDECLPMEGAVDSLEAMHRAGHKIVFVSYVMGNHFESKQNFLKRHFPFHSGFIATREKHLVTAADVIVDDRVDNLVRCNKAGIKAVQFDTPYTQSARADFPKIDKWDTESAIMITSEPEELCWSW